VPLPHPKPNPGIKIFRGFNAGSPYSVSGTPITATGQLKHNVEIGRLGYQANGLYYTTVIDLPLNTDNRDAWNSFLNTVTPANADTVLIENYPIPGWCTAF